MKPLLFCVLLALPLAAQNTVVRTSGTDCSAGQHVYGYNTALAALKCSADTGGSLTTQAFVAYPLFGYPSATIDNGFTFVALSATFFRFNVTIPMSFTNLSWHLAAAATSNCNGGAGPCGAQWAIYSTAGALQAATATVYSGGTPDLNTANQDILSPWSCPQTGCAATSAGTVTLQPGSYWLAFSTENVSVGVRAIGSSATFSTQFGAMTGFSSSWTAAYKASVSSGTGSSFVLPATVALTFASHNAPRAFPLVAVTQ